MILDAIWFHGKFDGAIAPRREETVSTTDVQERSSDRGSPKVFKAIRRIAHAIDVRSRAIVRAVGLTIPQLVILQAIREAGEVTTSALAAHADLSPATVVGILDKLEEKALVERYRSTVDRRVVHARLTAEGAARLDQAPPLLQDRFLAAFESLPAAERERITATLAAVAAMMSPEE
jgi:DNA-binding MarR family transcriptional regulator